MFSPLFVCYLRQGDYVSAQFHLFLWWAGWLGCRKDYIKTIRQISTKLGGGIRLGSRTPLNLGMELDKGADLGFFFLLIFSSTPRDRAFPHTHYH